MPQLVMEGHIYPWETGPWCAVQDIHYIVHIRISSDPSHPSNVRLLSCHNNYSTRENHNVHKIICWKHIQRTLHIYESASVSESGSPDRKPFIYMLTQWQTHADTLNILHTQHVRLNTYTKTNPGMWSAEEQLTQVLDIQNSGSDD